jgi:hypothetical protein
MLAAASIASHLRAEVSEGEVIDWFEQSYRTTYLRYLVFVSAFYQSIGKAGYFKTAEEMSEFDADPANLKRAFLNLVSGLEDFALAEQTTAHLMGEMTRRVRENLELRNNKSLLKVRREQESARKSDQFINAIEGLTCLSPEQAIGGLYVRARPNLGLARVTHSAAFPLDADSLQPVSAELAMVQGQ